MSRLTISPTGREILDDPATDRAAVALSLRNIARANRWFGGLAAVRYGLDRVLDRNLRRATLLDVGTGQGDVPLMARSWAKARGLDLEIVGVDRHPVAARLARGHGVPAVIACAGDLPVRSRGVDVVVVSQVAHHLDTRSCILLFRECHRVARLGVVIADLRRSRPAAAGFWLGSRLLRFDPVTCADGLTSLRRAFSVRQLQRLLEEADIPATVVRRPGARLVATWSTAR